jgi:hypothetical protein
MKKMVIFILFISMSTIANAQFQWGIIPGNIGMVFSDNNNFSLDVDIKFGYFSYELEIISNEKVIETGLGITWVPINYNYLFNNNYWSFINFQLFWNIFALIKTEYNLDNAFKYFFIDWAIFGPFAYINYAPNFDFNKYLFCYGIRYNWTGKFTQGYSGGREIKTRTYVFNIECGNRVIDNKNNFYFNIGVDFFFSPIIEIVTSVYNWTVLEKN